jgi:predicted transposase YdaD
MNEFERNRVLMELLLKLDKEGDQKSIDLIETFIVNETPSIKKSFELMLEAFKNTKMSMS